MNDPILEMLSTAFAPVVVITGEDNQGQNTVAMFWIEAALEDRTALFHNGCSNQGFRITKSALSSDERLAELMSMASEESTFVIADADCVPAVTLSDGKSGPEWLMAADEKRHTVVLTTVRGREYRLGAAITNAAYGHIQVEAAPHIPGIFVIWASGKLRERMPIARTLFDNDTILRWSKLTNGLYEVPSRPQRELIVSSPTTMVVHADTAEAVRSTETPMPKHPANSFLLTRVVKQNQNQQVRFTELLGMIWLESVNKSIDEEAAVRMVEWACLKWGMALDKVTLNPNTKYPDGWAETANGPVNIEVTKVQPKWPSGATLSQLTDSVRAGKEAVPSQAPVIKCRECGQQEVPDITDVHILPAHDESHVWTCTYPRSMVGSDWADNLTALPELRIDAEQFRDSIERAVSAKAKRAKRCGVGKQNWLVLIIEGFPTTEWIETVLHDMDWQSLDAVFAIVNDEFGSAIHGLYPDDNRKIVLLKCPEQNDHICYHPGFVMTVRKADGSMDALREQGQERGITLQMTANDGKVLAENEVELPQPISRLDVLKGIRAAIKSLPYEMLPNQDREMTGANKFPPEWDEERARRLIHHCESQTEAEAIAEDEAAFAISWDERQALRAELGLPAEAPPAKTVK